MAKALTFRQVARNYQRQADAHDKLAKMQQQAALDLPQNNQATQVQLMAALAAYDLALRSYFTAESMQAQSAAYTALADAAWDNGAGDPAEAP